ncbi:MAG: UbiA family prenyltransferase [Bacteroidota bacterium]
MFSRSSWLHLRIPFSYFLLPVYLFSLSISPNISEPRIFWVFFIVHFLLYPASNGYNSYFDKDEKSIGGLKNPPPVRKGLYFLALLFDALAVALGYWKLGFTFAALLLIYGLVSKAYSHPSVRVKKYAITGWLITGLFQGLFTFVMCYIGINHYALENVWKVQVLVPGILTSMMLWANYPMTQVYQHEEDGKRGDRTFSMLLGIRGTFYFVAAVFGVTTVGFFFYLNFFFSRHYAVVFLLALLPVLLYFGWWFLKVLKEPSKADFSHTMWLNFTSATCLNGFFIYLFLDSTQIMQVFN